MAATRTIRRRARSPWVRRLKRGGVFLGYTFGIAFIAGLVVYIPIYQEASDDAGRIESLLTISDSTPTVIWSADGKVLYSVAAVRRTVVDLKTLPPYIGYALVAAEDRRFYDHRGVDPVGLARAAFTTLRDRHGVQGGSTITMQLAKRMVNGDDRTMRRKLKDIATAQQIEALKPKDEILNLYANQVYYGEQAFGIEQAAKTYFGKSAKDLTVGEAALLARSVRAPSRINPLKNLKAMIPQRNYVLDVMRQEGWITQRQYDEGIREKPKLNPHPSYNKPRLNPDYGYFVDHVLQKFKDDFPDQDYKAGGFQIITTLDTRLQKRAIQAVRTVLRENRGHKVNDAAIVLMDADGRILAEVGGPDYSKRQFNVVTQGLGHQPGSAFKPIVYATALRYGKLHPGDSISNARIHKRLGPGRWWDPQNSSRFEDSRSSWSLEQSLAYSINRPAIHTIESVGPKQVVDTARDMFGIKSNLEPVDSLALGTSEVKPLEMLEAYSVFMLGGARVEPQPIDRIVVNENKVPKLLKKYEPVRVPARDATVETVAKQMDEVLKGPVWMRGGTANYAQAVENARGKTGTTNQAKDAWFCGYANGLVGVGWVGNSGKDGSQRAMSSSVFGGTVTVKIWTEVMLAAHELKLDGKDVRGGSPNTSVTVSAAPEPEVRPLREDTSDLPRHDPGASDPPKPDPVVIDPVPPVDPASSPDDSTPPTRSTDDPPPLTDDGPPTVDPSETPKRREKPKNSNEEATEEVEICVDTELKASMYCPETVTRRFPKGRGPRKVCTLHHG